MNADSPLTIAVVGCGAITAKYYVPAIKNSSLESEDIVFVDTNVDRATEMATRLGGAQAVAAYEDVLKDVDGAVVAVPHALHYPIAAAFLDAGTHVLVEKPLSETRQNADHLISLADDHGVSLAVNNTRRIFPSVRRVKSALKAGCIGEIEEIRIDEGLTFNWEAASGFRFTNTTKGILIDIGAHVLDILCYWLDERPTIEEYRDDSLGGIEATASLTVRSSNGARGSVDLSWLNPRANVFSVRGSDGILSTESYGWDTLTMTRDGTTETIHLSSGKQTFGGFVGAVFENFLQVLEGEADPFIPGSAVVDSIGLIEDCYDSRRTYEMPWIDPQ